MKFRIKEIDTYEIIYILLWIAFEISHCFLKQSNLCYMYDIDNYYTIVRYVIAIGLFFLLLTCKYNSKIFSLYLVIGIIAVITTIKSNDFNIFICILFILAGANVNIKKLIKVDLKVRVVLIITIVTMCLMGSIDNYVTYSTSGSMRQSMGFTHPNTFAIFAIVILVEWLYLRYEKLKWFDVAGMMLVIGTVSSLSKSRTSIFAFVLTLLVALIFKAIPRLINLKPIQYIWSFIPTILSIISFVLVKLYSAGNAIATAINLLLTTRLSVASKLLNAYGISLLGQYIETFGTRTRDYSSAEYFSVDMAYINIPIKYGVIILILLCFGYFLSTRRILKEKNIALGLCILFFCISGFAEGYLYRHYYNFTLIAIMQFIMRQDMIKSHLPKIRIK